MEYKKISQEELSKLFNSASWQRDGYKEVYTRIAHSFEQFDGTFSLPNSFEGDIFKTFLATFLNAPKTLAPQPNKG